MAVAELPPVNRRTLISQIFGVASVPTQAHPGLVFDRYLRIWNAAGTNVQRPPTDALHEFVEAYNKLGSTPDRTTMLAHLHARQGVEAHGASLLTRTVTTAARLAMGLGADHPLENGFTFDRVLGVPYLPGTSLKGLCRAESRLPDASTEEDRLRFLGSAEAWDESPGDPRQRGAVCFLDAYPVDWPWLDVDVLTPHYKQYYDEKTESPFDWDEPVPIYFLTVKPRTKFAVRLICDVGSSSERRMALDWAWAHLKTGLEVLGLGAKTAVGYGVMSVEEAPEGGGRTASRPAAS